MCLLGGDIDTAVSCATFYCHAGAFAGKNLAIMTEKYTEFAVTMTEKKQYQQLMLLGVPNNFFLSQTEFVDDTLLTSTDDLLEHALSENKILLARLIYFYRMYESFWKRRFEESLDYAEKYTNLKGPGKLMTWQLEFCRGIMSFFFARKTNATKWIEEGKKSLAILESLASKCSWNYENKFLLLQAEFHHCHCGSSDGEGTKALEYYKRAAQLAHERRFTHEEGLSHELLAYYHEGRGESLDAMESMKKAHSSYEKWGAVKKCNELDGWMKQR